MGKNHRYKKQLKSERAKVKLKDKTKTKFLPKGQNVTKVEFKVKSIVLMDQLKEKESGVPISQRKLNLKELLHRLKHYNENMRHGACEELDAFLKVRSEEILSQSQHLSDLLKTICNLAQDREGKIRKSAVKVIDSILKNSTAEDIRPYFQYLLVNLKCAMTHINKNIQEDSLLLLDTMLKHIPSLVANDSSKILRDFFSLISRLKNESGVDRTLTVNLGSKMISVQWRIKVLSRLYGIMDAIITEKKICDNKNKNSETSKPIIFTPGLTHVPIYKKTWINNNPPNIFELLRSSGKQENTNDDEALNRHLLSSFPLLYDIWMEALPENVDQNKTENTLLNEETAAVHCCIIKLLDLFWQYAEIYSCDNSYDLKKVFLSKDVNKFMDHIIKYFPYVQESKQRQKKASKKLAKVLETNDDTNCVRENLLICTLYLRINLEVSNDNKFNIEPIIDYITTCLSIKNFVREGSVPLFISLLKLILVDSYQNPRRKTPNVDDVLENAVEYYKTARLSNQHRIELCKILTEVSKNSYLNMLSCYHDWLGSLPKLLLQRQISISLVKLLLDVSKRNIKPFHKSLLNNLETILGNLPNLELTGLDDVNTERRVKGLIASIFYYVPVLEPYYVNKILAFICLNQDALYQYSFTYMMKERFYMGKPEVTKEMGALKLDFDSSTNTT